ncbi:Crp/Fnr family transcriptional regulator [Parapedobacter koreensis]|uniref:cAMP-binding domain of CRP or a regulatory subunit of cAMP-dependent protein kinases n=1 Tax=Parapedobacter koreensis TaxID=332977 RepID=A0A1H7RJ29_9SPHI|nr:Crp/Fnr family transcriptional regulator [Parapedobacter koreensis]SEL60105.1 cAMP-binding domain of CRP or a regulatory subunit of cAMP-dependent protein kinases [Parapedobacter koreensis]
MIPTDLLIQRGASYRKATTGDIIFNEGAPAAYYYQLVSGRVRWCNITDDGREILHKVVEAGESFGEFPLFDGGTYAASAIADTPCLMLRLCVSSFHQLLREHPDIHFAFTKSLVQHLRFKFLLTDLLSKNSPETVIAKLISHFNQQGKFICQDCNRLMLTRQQLANMTGLRVETIIRAIKHMEKEERLSIVKGKVFVPADGL